MRDNGFRRLPQWLRRLRLVVVERFASDAVHATLAWAAVLGFTGALATIGFREAIRALQWLLAERSASLVETARELPSWQRLLIPVGGGIFAGLILQASQRRRRETVASDYMEAISIGDGRIGIGQSLARSASSLFTIASGGSIGREGSMVQLAAMVASALGRLTRPSPPRLRLFVACGAAAGITAAYNAPIAGALFVAEIVLGSIAMESFGPLLVAAVVSNVTMRAFPGYGAPYEMPAFPVVAGREMVLFAGLGLLAGASAPLFLGLLETAKAGFARLPLPLAARLGIGGLAVGVISVWVPEVWGNGYSVVNSILHQQWLWPALLTVLLGKLAATGATAGSGAVGGIFTPTLFVGAALGSLFGHAVQALWPGATSAPFAYAVVGMGAFLAATTHAPLMAIVMIFEMTLSYDVVLPLMLGCVIAYFVARSYREASMYSASVRRSRGAEIASWESLSVGTLIKPALPCIGEEATLADVERAFLAHPVRHVYVLDAQRRLSGAIALQEVQPFLFRRGSLPEPRIADLIRRDFPLLTPDTNLGDALQKFLGHSGERLPVVASDSDRRLLGVVSKSDLLLHIHEAAQNV
ncbi:MAG TPA: ClcB-like voltage-gated chloride channel protein [Casimicrobiaceae bacterium]